MEIYKVIAMMTNIAIWAITTIPNITAIRVIVAPTDSYYIQTCQHSYRISPVLHENQNSNIC